MSPVLKPPHHARRDAESGSTVIQADERAPLQHITRIERAHESEIDLKRILGAGHNVLFAAHDVAKS